MKPRLLPVVSRTLVQITREIMNQFTKRLRAFAAAAFFFCPIAILSMLANPSIAQTQSERSDLPIRDPAFQRKIGQTFADSTSDFPQDVTVPDGAPNVLLILLDDVGFGM